MDKAVNMDEEVSETNERSENLEESAVTVTQEDGSRASSANDFTSHTAASSADTLLITNTHSEQDSGSLPEPHPSTVHLTVTNSTAALTDDDGEERGWTTRNNNEEEEEEEEGLVVLDPEHPIMKRFQFALKKHLTTQMEKLELEMREKVALERAESSQLEERSVLLYSVQQELARMQSCLDWQHEASARAAAQRKEAEEQLQQLRSQFRSAAEKNTKIHTRVSELQLEEDRLALQLLHMQEITTNLRSDVTVTKNTTRKARADKLHATEEKQRQDLYVERLTKQEDRLREQIALYEIEVQAQAEETKAAREAQTETQMELDSLIMDNKQMLQQWTNSLVVLKKKDEAYTTMQDALKLANQELRCLETEEQNYTRLIARQQEDNERLTVRLNRSELESATYRKLIAQTHSKQQALQASYSTYTRTLQETNNNLRRVTAECGVYQSELAALRQHLERESSVRLDLEEKIMRKIQEQLTHDSSAKCTQQLINKASGQIRDKESQVWKLESELAAVALEASESALRLEALLLQQAELDQQISLQHQLLSSGEAEISRRDTRIERNQATLSSYKNNIHKIVARTGHEDLAPLEILKNSLLKQLEELETESKEKQQLWLRQQEALVRMSQDRQSQNNTLQTLLTQLSLLQQDKIRKEGETGEEQRELADLEKLYSSLLQDRQRLKSLLDEQKDRNQTLQQSNTLMQTSFIEELKDAERESVEMQLCLEKLEEEKERLNNTLVEAERQIMLWEKKIQLVREMHSTVGVGKEDMSSMKAEIHRMKVRHTHLMKQQEGLLREMEAAVARRESIVVRGEGQSRSHRTRPTRTEFQHTLQALRRDILHTHKQIEQCDGVLAQLQEQKNALSETLRDKQHQIGELQNTNTVLDKELGNLQDIRERNQAQLLALQARAKQLQAVKESRYTPTAGREEALELNMQKEQERLHTVGHVLQQLVQDHPQHLGQLRKVINMCLESRAEMI